MGEAGLGQHVQPHDGALHFRCRNEGAARNRRPGWMASTKPPPDDAPDGRDELSFSEDDDEETWIEWFCRQDGNEFFCEVDEEFIDDEFNLYGLKKLVPHYNDALNTLFSVVESQQEAEEMTNGSTCKLLYGLIHARYVVTTDGMKQMYDKFRDGVFGACPRVLCNVRLRQ